MHRPARLDLVHKAICAGYRGQIEWKPACLERFRDDPKMQSFTEIGVKELLCEFVRNGGTLEIRPEKDPYWLEVHPDDPWWYFAAIPVPEFRDGLFVKVKLILWDNDDEDDPWVQIVSIH